MKLRAIVHYVGIARRRRARQAEKPRGPCPSEARYQGRIALQHGDRLGNHVLDDLLRRLDRVDSANALPRQAVHGVEQLPAQGHVLALGLHVMRKRDNARVAQLLDLRRRLLPTLDPIVGNQPQRAAGEDKRAHGVVAGRLQHLVLVRLGRRGLLRADEARAHPDARRAQGERSREAPAVVDAPRGNADDGHAKGALAAAACVDNLGDERQRADVAGVPAALTALGDDDVNPRLQRLLRVPDRAHHVGDYDAAGVQLVHRPTRWHTDGTDEELRLLGNNDVNQLRQVAVRVVVIRLPRAAPNLRNGQVHPKGQGLVHELLLDPGDLLLEDLRGHGEASDGANPASIGDGGRQVGVRHTVHAGQHHRVLDAQNLGERSADRRHGGQRGR
mmetsp:Transcript_65103/g.173577  ORF Transcript_65103/g.173577 Transcript_65103/m.173577 type:complete len:388 (+) Transcript_65103:2-1165(+)